MKKWLRVLAIFGGGIAALWALLYIVFWYQRTGCWAVFDRACNDGLIHWLERLVTLGWVRDYQQLLTGILTLAAGAFVIIAAIITGEHLKSLEIAKRRDESVAAATVVAARFLNAAVAFQRDYATENDAQFSMVDNFAPDLAKIDPMLASVVMAEMRDAARLMFQHRGEIDPMYGIPVSSLNHRGSTYPNEHTIASAKCYAIVEILNHIAKNLDSSGRYDFYHEGSIPPGALASTLQYLKVSRRNIFPLDNFFDWNGA